MKKALDGRHLNEESLMEKTFSEENYFVRRKLCQKKVFVIFVWRKQPLHHEEAFAIRRKLVSLRKNLAQRDHESFSFVRRGTLLEESFVREKPLSSTESL